MGREEIVLANKRILLTPRQLECLQTLLVAGRVWTPKIMGVKYRTFLYHSNLLKNKFWIQLGIKKINEIRAFYVLIDPYYRNALRELAVSVVPALPPNLVISWREFEVLNSLFSGKTFEDIGRSLFLSKDTVEFHTLQVVQRHFETKDPYLTRLELLALLLNYGFPFLRGESLGSSGLRDEEALKVVRGPIDPSIWHLFPKSISDPSTLKKKHRYPFSQASV